MDASMIVAITGAVVGLGGLALNLRGQSAQRIEQQAANAVLSTKTRLDETQQALDASTRRAELAESGERALREENQRLRGDVDRLEDEVDEATSLRRHMLSQQEARCREQLTQITDVAITLRKIVTDEAARAAAAVVLDRALPHPHDTPAQEIEEP